MEIKIYFAVKVLCAIFILYRLWIFIFSQQMYDAWEKVYRMMRIARIKLWKYLYILIEKCTTTPTEKCTT